MIRRWSVSDLFTDHVTGKLRETATWSNLGKMAVLYEYLRVTSETNFESTTGVMAGILIFHELAARYFNQRQQTLVTPNATPSEPAK
jgi:hypothetical protein